MQFNVQGYLYIFRIFYEKEQTFITKWSLKYVHSELQKKKSLWAHYNLLIALHSKF